MEVREETDMRKMFSYLKKYRVLALVSMLMMAGEVLADLLLPYLMSYIVNYGITGISVDDPENGSTVAAGIMQFFWKDGYSNMNLIVTFGILMLVITLIGGIFGVSCAFTSATAAQGVGYDLRKDAYTKIMHLSIEQTDHFTTGSLVTRMTNDITMVVDFFESLMRGFVRAPMFIIGGAVMLVMLNLRFSAILLCAVPVMAFVLIYVLLKAIPMYSVLQTKLDKVNSVVQENVSGARFVKAYNRESYEGQRFRNANGELRDVNFNVLKLIAVINPVLTIVQNFAVIAVIYVGGYSIRIQEAGMTTGSIMAAITYMTQIIMSIMMVVNIFQQISRATASSARIQEVLDTEPVVTGGIETEASHEEIILSMNDVSFSYPQTTGSPVLNHIDLDVRRGETLAIIGATGSGKSTLMSLIPRFYDPTSGSIALDGKPIASYDLTALRSRISYVTQKSELFSDTVEGNIRWGKKDATEEELEEAAETAQAMEFISGLKEGMQDYIAEKGASLSGGQKQRMSLARALVRKPEILLMDDATSALDLETESKLHSALHEHLSDTTVIVIAQRIASVMEADRIAVMENDGRILYCDTHENLLKISDTYRDIYDSQMRSGALMEGGM